MDNRNHCMSVKQAKCIVNAHKHNSLNSFCNNWYFYVKQHENNNENQSKIKRERESSYANNSLVECHSMAKRPDWAMKYRTVLNINEFILFDMFGRLCINKFLVLCLCLYPFSTIYNTIMIGTVCTVTSWMLSINNAIIHL